MSSRTIPSRYPQRATYDQDAAYALLDEAYICHFGVIADGDPRVLPTLFVRVDNTLYLHGSTAAHWMLAARGDGGLPICVAVTEIDALVLARSQINHSANYRSLVAHGTARLVTDEAAKRTAMDALVEKVGTGRTAHTRPPTAAEMAKTAVLALDLTEVSLKRRMHGVGDDEEDLGLPYWAGVVPLTKSFGYAVPDDGVTVPAPDYVRVRSPYQELVTLRGEHVVLEPLSVSDAAEAFVAFDDAEVWAHAVVPRPLNVEDMAAVIQRDLDRRDEGKHVPFTIRDAATGELIGATSYYDLYPGRETIAIGGTRMARSRWRTAANTEAKLLLLTHAFEVLGAGRVEWHTDIRNERSQAAIARLGATREGVLRRHKQRGDGTWRDSVQYSMTIDDWPGVKERLSTRLSAGQPEPVRSH